MERRDFIGKTTLGTLGLIASPGLSQLFAISNNQPSQIPLQWKIHPDGSYDLISESITLSGCYPAINGESIKPLSVSINGNQIKYKLNEGNLTLFLKIENGNGVLGTSYEEISKAPHWIQPMANAKVGGMVKYFYQGVGFSGPSGIADLNEATYKTPQKTEEGGDAPWMLESYLLSALIDKQGSAIAVAALDHKNFLQKSTLKNESKRWGLLNRHLLDEKILYQAEFSTEEIPLANKKLTLPDLYFIADTSAWAACTTMAKEIAKEMAVPVPQKPRYHWCSWYIKHENFTRNDLNKFLEGIKKIKPSPNFQTIQIDDGYQKFYGDWLDFKDSWPGGIQSAFSEIKKRGYNPGIWVGPFMVHKQSVLFKNHPDWILKRPDGTMIEEGGHYILDSSHPEAFAYLRSIFKTLKQAGATFFKTDFMDWGLQDSLKIKRHTSGKTSVQYFREVLQMIREEIGPDSYWLACISPFAPFLGYANGIRVANDTPTAWINLKNMFSQMIACHYMNHIFWQNDPDITYLSLDHNQYTKDELMTIAYFTGIIGGSVNTSEWLYNSKSVKLWRFLSPSEKPISAKLHNWPNNELIIALRNYEEAKATGILFSNISEKIITQQFNISELLTTSELFAFEWGVDSAVALGKKTTLSINLKPHQSMLYYFAKENKGPSENLSIGGKVWN